MSANPHLTEMDSLLAPAAWDELERLDLRHTRLESEHERMRRRLDAAIVGPDAHDLRVAWDSYRAVLATLNEASESIEQFRLSNG